MTTETQGRLLSLDFFRGATMLLLAGESTGIYEHWEAFTNEGTWWHAISIQFHHHPWNGLRFWDLVQPFFMFIVGVAMVYSIHHRKQQQTRWSLLTMHIVKRCVILFLLGVSLHCVYQGRLVWELWNVLTQLSFTILLAFLIIRLPLRTQLLISLTLIVLTEGLYRLTNIPGYDQPFVMGENFGSFMDMVLMGKINDGGWVTINCIPTTAHTIWGVLAGRVLLEHPDHASRLRILLIAGAIGLLVGYSLDWAGVTPIVKRICTSSFIFASGGWCLLTLAASYWFIDVKQIRSWVFFFAVVGMNPIFIYLFGQTIGYQWFNDFIAIFSNGVLSWVNAGQDVKVIIAALMSWAAQWYLCYWLYRKRVFIKV